MKDKREPIMLNKKVFFIWVALIIMATFAQVCKGADFLTAIAIVESNKNDNAVGDNGNAVGRYQIWKAYVDDVNRILKLSKSTTRFNYNDRRDPVKAAQMVRIYMSHYGKRYKKVTGKNPTLEVYARIHNGGPNGWKKPATIKYWKKVQKEMVK